VTFVGLHTIFRVRVGRSAFERRTAAVAAATAAAAASAGERGGARGTESASAGTLSPL